MLSTSKNNINKSTYEHLKYMCLSQGCYACGVLKRWTKPNSIRQALIDQGMSEDEAKENRNRMKVRKEKQIIEGIIACGGSPVPTAIHFSTLSSPVLNITETVTTTTTAATVTTTENDTVAVTNCSSETTKTKKKQIQRISEQVYAEAGQKCVQQKKEDIAFIETATKYEAEN